MMDKNNSETCNLFTVKNTPSGARRDATSVMYYYIDIDCDDIEPFVPTWKTLRSVIESIWDVLSVCDLTSLDKHYICAYMTDGTNRKVRYIQSDRKAREIRIKRVR